MTPEKAEAQSTQAGTLNPQAPNLRDSCPLHCAMETQDFSWLCSFSMSLSSPVFSCSYDLLQDS